MRARFVMRWCWLENNTMRDTRIVMGMPVSVEITDAASPQLIEDVYDYFNAVDARFSLYKDDSEISQFNRGSIQESALSAEMHDVFALAERTKLESDGYFEIKRPDGQIDPSGIVKGWAIRNAAQIIRNAGVRNYYVDAGGDIQAEGKNDSGEDWRVGIRNPFNDQQVIKVVSISGQGIATSGTYVRGQHIYNPHQPQDHIDGVVSLSVIGPDVLEADRFATAAFAMGEDGIYFIENLTGFEGYMVNANGIATMTTGFGAYVIS
jgi:FAD:protein FMN transferase